MKEYNVGIKHEKSALDNFAEKCVIHGKPGIFPIDFFREKVPQIKKKLKNHRNIKVRFVMTFMMEQVVIDKIIAGLPRAKRAWDRAPYSWNMVNLFSFGCHVIDRAYVRTRLQIVRVG